MLLAIECECAVGAEATLGLDKEGVCETRATDIILVPNPVVEGAYLGSPREVVKILVERGLVDIALREVYAGTATGVVVPVGLLLACRVVHAILIFIVACEYEGRVVGNEIFVCSLASGVVLPGHGGGPLGLLDTVSEIA